MTKRLIILITLVLGVTLAKAQQSLDAMKKDYPGLMSLYGDRISGQKAHYIFVVDVSSSMLPYETVVKNNFLQFMEAVPDGDQVSLIKMSDENNTGFVGLLKCTPLDQSTRASIKEVVNGFRFNKPGSLEDGSDGFSMAKSVIDAINVVGSNDLTFVYMLTDFEYWTHINKYDKNKENWNSLTSLLPKQKMDGMCKYGIELNSGGRICQGAIFKNELDRVFGNVEYQSVGSVSLLSNWFSHIATSVMSVKLNSLLKADWKQVEESIKSSVTISGNEVDFHLDAARTPLVNGAVVTLKTGNSYYSPIASSGGSFPGIITVGNLNLPSSERCFFPSFRQMGGDEYEAKITFQSPYADEISRLQGVCGEVGGQKDALNLTRIESGNLPSANVWNSILPIWVWILILLIVLAIIASFIYTTWGLKTTHTWMVKVKEDGMNIKCPAPGFTASFTIGKGGDYPVPNANWQIKVNGKKYNPLIFWKKSGYYMIWTGSPMTIKDQYREDVAACAPNEETWFSPLKSGGVFVIEKNNHRIELVV